VEENENHYSASEGVAELRQAIAKKEKRVNGVGISADDVLVTSGISEGIEMTLAALVEKGDEILRKYGFFQQGPRSNTADRYKKILENGGVREFCLEQILELGWHRKPPKGIKFPQLEGLSPIDHKCKYCGKVVLGCKVVRGEDGSVELEEEVIVWKS